MGEARLLRRKSSQISEALGQLTVESLKGHTVVHVMKEMSLSYRYRRTDLY